MELGLQGKLAVVTGSTSGIGKAIAAAFARAGARVVVNGRKQATVDSTIQELKDSHPAAELVGVVGDVSTADGAAKFCADVDAIGPVYTLVLSAGIFAVEDFFDISDDTWQRFFEVNFFSNVRLSRHFLKPMLERNEGRMILISSEAGLRIIKSMIHYSTTKTAQIGLAQGLAQLTQGTNVTVNSVAVGPTQTEGVDEFIKGKAVKSGRTPEEEAKVYFTETEPTSLLGRFLKPQEVANAVLWLGSAAASGVNGSVHRVEGGIVRHI